MTDIDRLCDTDTIERMVRLVDHDWTVRRDTSEASGRHFLHRLCVDTPSGSRECILKAPEDDVEFCAEARLLTVLGTETDLPVPAVLGVVDKHETVPTPFFVMEPLPGDSIHKTKTDTLSRSTLRQIAVSSGRHLATLHDLNAVDTYGVITVNRTETLSGGRPAGRLDQLTVPEGDRFWPTHVETSIEGILDNLPDSRFEGIIPDVRSVVGSLVTELRADGPFEPVVGRVENSLDNILIDAATGEVTGMLDWEFVATMTAANDLVLAEFWLSGGPWGLLPSTPDYRQLIRTDLLEGYRNVGCGQVVEEFHSHRDLYELLQSLRTMLLFDGMFDPLGATEEQREKAAAMLRERAEDIVDDNL
jgi:aminoglycoside phosphotransferase (APT) family kinase protein